MAAPTPEITSVLEKLPVDRLGSGNDLRAWLVLLAAAVAGLMAGRLTAWACGDWPSAARRVAGPAGLKSYGAWRGPPAWLCSPWDWNWGWAVTG